MPAALFSGLFASALLLGLVEAVHTALGPPAGVPTSSRVLAGLFALAPYALIGVGAGALLGALTAVWMRARRHASDARLVNDLVAGLVALGAFGGALGLTALVLRGARVETEMAALGLALTTPVALLPALAAGLLTRATLRRADALTAGRPVLGVLALLGTVGGVVAVALHVAGDEALAQRLGRWPPLFLTAWPLLTVIGTAAIARLDAARHIIRLAVPLALLSSIGLARLTADFDARPGVKTALLEHSLVYRRALDLARPLFDADRDGYAGLLGGGDCDDANPAVHPGAPEIPRNGLDDDCFGGDSPGRRPVRKRRQAPVRESSDLVLVERPDLVLITVDTLRADHLGYHGYPRPTSPNLDRLATAGLHFKWAFAQGPQTKASMPSVFTGRYSSEVIRTHHRWARTKAENVTLAEHLKAGGYYTAGFPSHNYFRRMYGLHQGFDHWDLSLVQALDRKTAYRVTGGQIVDQTLGWLEQRAAQNNPQPVFVWVHLFDPHWVYKDHAEWDFGTRRVDLYDEEIAYTDQQLGRLLERLAAPPFAGRTYVMVHSDHGEAFSDHGYGFHGQHLFNDQIHVPLSLTGPGLPGRAIGTPVSGLDIVPTLLDLAGLPVPDTLPGLSLVPYATEHPPEHGPVFAEMLADANHSDRRVIVDWPYKLQWGITFGEHTLYDLSVDPHETEDLSRERPAVFRRLYARLRQWMAEEVEVHEPVVE